MCDTYEPPRETDDWPAVVEGVEADVELGAVGSDQEGETETASQQSSSRWAGKLWLMIDWRLGRRWSTVEMLAGRIVAIWQGGTLVGSANVLSRVHTDACAPSASLW